ncbi:MAG: hypothetical protein JWP89_5398 [Schlesneria sp.]|nr:hypothetical protein [Schlesneria sp.]
MDSQKCQALKGELERQGENPLVSIDQFFDGNDDLGSIGCNLAEHPGMEVFRDVLTGLLERDDVEGVYALIYEIDPGEDSWPFTDTILVVGAISEEELRAIVTPLDPDEIGTAEEFGVPAAIIESHRSPILGVWWD